MSLERTPSLRARHNGPGWPLLAILGAGAIVVGVMLFAFASPFGGSDDKPAERYIEAVAGSSSRVNPLFVHLNDTDRDLARLAFSGLVRLDTDGTPLPDLAESWETSPDGKTVTFHLRAGVVWHTGAPFTADDVTFTYDLLSDPNLQGDPEQAALWQTVDCAAADDLTLACTLPEPFSPFLAYATMGILPRHILEGATAQTIFDDAFNRAPIGTGPYRLAQLDSNRALFKANESYYLGTPPIDEIELRFYPDASSAAADVVRGEADGMLADLSINPDDFKTLSDEGSLQGYTANRSAYAILFLNNAKPPFNDPAVRRALSYTIDVDAIIAQLLAGRALRADSPIPPGTWAADADVRAATRDVGRAREVLDKAGWVLNEAGNVRQRSNQELRFTLLTDQDSLRGAVADAIAAQMADAGIQATVVQRPSNGLVRDALIPREYQAAVFSWEPGPDPDPYPAWHSSQISSTGRNLASYSKQANDRVMEAARQTYSMDSRKQLYSQFQEIFLQDTPSVTLYYPLYTYFVSDKVTKIDIGVLFDSSSRFYNVHEWTIESAPEIGEQ